MQERLIKVGRAEILLGLLVAATHYGYNFLPEGAPQKSYFYVMRGLEAAAAFWWLSRKLIPGSIGVLVCFWAIGEELQTAACGIATAPSIVVPSWSGLCVQAFGAWGYAAFGAAIFVYWWSHGDKNRSGAERRGSVADSPFVQRVWTYLSGSRLWRFLGTIRNGKRHRKESGGGDRS